MRVSKAPPTRAILSGCETGNRSLANEEVNKQASAKKMKVQQVEGLPLDGIEASLGLAVIYRFTVPLRPRC
jgi:hypothetical protein